MEVYYGDKKICLIPDESIPIFYYSSRVLGFQVDLNMKDGKLKLLPGLSNKKVLFFQEQNVQTVGSRESHEKLLLQAIKNTLLSCGVQIRESENMDSEPSNLIFSLTLTMIPDLNQPVLEIYHDNKTMEVEWINNLKTECLNSNIKLVIYNIDSNETYPTIKAHAICPDSLVESFWETAGKALAHSLSIGLIGKLHGNSRISPLSIIPYDVLMKDMFQSNQEESVSNIQSEKLGNESAHLSNPQFNQKLSSDAEAFFDYHVFINQSNIKSPKIFGNLSIKNIGSAPLKNPYVCFRITPAGSVSLVGQILPPNAIQTKGIQSADGPKGWRYMNDNWQKEADEKGEIWVCPIHELYVNPGEFVSLSNIQIKVLNLENNNIKVEAFIYFPEEELEIAANNKISLLIN